jgi:V/A-type H+-transporting ATPase subunit D
MLGKAYSSLKEASIENGPQTIETLALGSNLEADFFVDYRSIMGVTVPVVEFQSTLGVKPDYGFGNTSVELDIAFKLFYSVLELLAQLARDEGTTFQIANDVKKTQRRVNALNHVLIPQYQGAVKRIALVLEEREREEFVRTKSIKRMIKEREKI